MKNNKGITLVALVVIIVLLIIFSSAAIYTSVQSFKMIDLQKYKAQMQAIQNGLDEFYAEYENTYEKYEDIFHENAGNEIEYMELYLSYMKYIKEYNIDKNFSNYVEAVSTDNYNKAFDKLPTWWENIAESRYGITIEEPKVKNQYYALDKAEIEKLLDLSDIDISENFIINFQKRYVFSEDSMNISLTKPDKSGEIEKDIYCLYELSEEEKVIEFKADNTGGFLEIEIIEKTLSYQTIKVTLRAQDSTIEEIYYNDIDGASGASPDSIPTVQSKKELFGDVSGLGTSEVFIKIKKDGSYNFIAEDTLEGIYSGNITIFLHEPPVLQDNMVPFKVTEQANGIMCDINDIEWYNYTNKFEDTKFATAVLEDTGRSKYTEENKGKIISNLYKNDTDEPELNLYYYKYNEKDTDLTPDNTNGVVVKVWIPYAARALVINEGIATNEEFINKTGIWLDAEWDYINEKWIPVEHKHYWGERSCSAEGEDQSRCKKCGLIEARTNGVLEHDMIEETIAASCNVPGGIWKTCRICGHRDQTGILEALGHNYGAWYRDIEPGCESDGCHSRECSRCGNIDRHFDIKPKGHDWIDESRTAPTFAARGTINQYCNRCRNNRTIPSNEDLIIIEEYNTRKNGTWQGFNATDFGGNASPRMENGITVDYENSKVAVTNQLLNLTDVATIKFEYKLWDNLYDPLGNGIGVNNTYLGVSNDTGNNTSFAKAYNHTLTRNPFEDQDPNNVYDCEVDVSQLTGNYRIKIYVRHENLSLTGHSANSAYIGIKSIVVKYKPYSDE